MVLQRQASKSSWWRQFAKLTSHLSRRSALSRSVQSTARASTPRSLTAWCYTKEGNGSLFPIKKSRSCPSCGESVGWSRLWFKSWTWATWSCKQCGAELGFNARRRVIISFVQAPFFVLGMAPMLQGYFWPALISLPIWAWVWTYDSVECRQVCLEKSA